MQRKAPAPWRTEASVDPDALIVHLIDGTYELFRHFHGLQRFSRGRARPFGAAAGVLGTVLGLIEQGATHIGVATDHVIESFRNTLWSGYKTGAGVDPALAAQFDPLEQGLTALGVRVWPMTEFEADDALASAAHRAALDPRVLRVCIWTPDKDLAQCVREGRVVQMDRRAGALRDASAVQEKFGVPPERIPDLLALSGDSSDGYPGVPGIGRITAARLIAQYGALEEFPTGVLGDWRERALLFKQLATLRLDVPVFDSVAELRWRGPAPQLESLAGHWSEPLPLARVRAAAARVSDAGPP